MDLPTEQKLAKESGKPIGLVVLAAGGSSRMGTPKQLLTYAGETLLKRAVYTALQSGCQSVTVVIGAEAEKMRAQLIGLPVQIVQNDRWPEGMASSIVSGLSGAIERAPDLSAVLFMLCDQPLLSPEILRDLLRSYSETQSPIVASAYPGGAGVPALFDRLLFPELFSLQGSQGAKCILAAHPESALILPFPDGQFDIDTPADYQILHALNDPNS